MSTDWAVHRPGLSGVANTVSPACERRPPDYPPRGQALGALLASLDSNQEDPGSEPGGSADSPRGQRPVDGFRVYRERVHRRAADGVRTRDLHLGKVALYRLSYNHEVTGVPR